GCGTEWLTREEVAERLPGTDDVLGASFNQRDGFLDPATVATAYARRARAKGAVVRTGTMVTGIEVSGGRATAVVLADGSRVGAGVVVNAAGAWAPLVAALYGGTLPILPWRSQIFTVHDVPPESLRYPMVIDFDGGKGYLHPEGLGLMIGMDNEGTAPLELEPKTDWSKLPAIVESLLSRMPGLESASAGRAWAGFLELTPDEDPVVGWTHLDNLYTSAGFSGHGLSIAPALAEQAALEIQGLAPEVDLEPFRLARFDRPGTRPEVLAMR
ncbi:MAG: NAD(P)/FAD-dependent oxidoreductase, partial [Solirubrobacteraceae bacterium]